MASLKTREIKLSSEKYNIKCPYSMVPQFVVVHNTANDASAENEIKYMQSNNNEVSFHYAVDDKEAVLGIPLNRNAWHAGDGGSGRGNRYGIAIEICYSKSGGVKFEKSEKNAAILIASILKKHGWGIDKVTKHQDYSGKYCPHRTLDMGWDRFKNMVKEQLSSGKPSRYTSNGLCFEKINKFGIQYFEKPKKNIPQNSSTGGFWAPYTSADNIDFTLPVGNLVCDISIDDVPDVAKKYIYPYVQEKKLRISCNQNQSVQFKGKQVSTLIVPASGNPYIDEINKVPDTAVYAISGVPTVRNGDDVSYKNFVIPQGWDGSCMYATHRSWIGIRNGEIWRISGNTTTGNYITNCEFWEKVKNEGFDDIIALDGGGSWAVRRGSSYSGTAGNRIINNIITVS